MELTFEKQGNFYVSEFQLTSDANLHIEKSTGKLQLFQRTIGAGDYAEVKDFDTSDYDSDKIIDIDLQSLVYPKWIKIKSAVKPLVATITTDGEVHEVVYQAKEIEITSNGTTKVTADTGYTALASVNVKVNVPTEGGEGGNCEEQQVEYWEFISWNEVPDNPIIDLHGPYDDMLFDMAMGMGEVIKYKDHNGEIKYAEPPVESNGGIDVKAACVIPSKIINNEMLGPVTMEQIYDCFNSSMLAGGNDWRFIIKRKITREEFYADINTDDTYVSKVIVGPMPGMPDAPAMWLDVNTGSIVKNVAGGLQVNDNNGKKMMRIPQSFGQFCLYSPVPIEAPKIISGDVRPYSADEQWYGATTRSLGTVEFELPFGSLMIEVYDDSQVG